MSTAFGYIRASMQTQILTLPHQREKIEAYFKDRCPGLEFGGNFQDKATSSRIPLAKRKQGAEMLLRLKPGDHIIVTSFDRCFRSLSEAIGQLERWFSNNIKVHVLNSPVDTSTTMGRLILQLLAWVAEFEREMIRDRTQGIMSSPSMKLKQKTRTSRGKLGYGAAPLGFVSKGAVGRKYRVEDKEEREIMGKIVFLRDTNHMTWDEIRKALMLAKLVTRHGNWWCLSRIQRGYAAELKLRTQSNRNGGGA